jgi:hypothetical protein
LKLDYLDRGRLCCPRTPQQRELLPLESRAPKQRCCCYVYFARVASLDRDACFHAKARGAVTTARSRSLRRVTRLSARLARLPTVHRSCGLSGFGPIHY